MVGALAIATKLRNLMQLIRGWINYFKIGSENTLQIRFEDSFRLRMWIQWKTPQNREKNLVKLGIDRNIARRVAYTGRE